MEKDSPLVLDLRLTPLKAGELSIHGIEYSLKAVFPQSESTDYTIKGKQPLIVQGPRLNSTKETKCSKTPLYMKDSRLTCKVVSKQPRLQLGTFSIPETMYQVKSFYTSPVMSYLYYCNTQQRVVSFLKPGLVKTTYSFKDNFFSESADAFVISSTTPIYYFLELENLNSVIFKATNAQSSCQNTPLSCQT